METEIMLKALAQKLGTYDLAPMEQELISYGLALIVQQRLHLLSPMQLDVIKKLYERA